MTSYLQRIHTLQKARNEGLISDKEYVRLSKRARTLTLRERARKHKK